jgi:uncharacterized phage protein (TIGR02216 family)
MSGRSLLPQPFPWAAAMRFGLGCLRLPPDQFWSMTPLELAAATEGFNGIGPQALPLDSLQRLMIQFPDTPKSKVPNE